MPAAGVSDTISQEDVVDIAIVQRPLAAVQADWLILTVTEQGEFTPDVAALDAALNGRLTRLREGGDLTSKAGDLLELRDGVSNGPQRILVAGLGPAEKVNVAALDKTLMAAIRRISTKKYAHVAATLPVVPDGPAAAAQVTATALQVGCVGQGLYRKEPERFEFERVTVVAPEGTPVADLQPAIDRGRIIGQAVNLARELVNRHPGELYPETFARRAEQSAAQFGLQCDILDELRLQQERMNSLLGVAQGSTRPPRVVVLEYRGADVDAPTWGWCGKGVTFDSGGLSLKPTDGMKTMKADMSGAATVLAAMAAVAQLRLPVNVLGVMGLVENMPSGSSYKLGDVLTARNGVTIEVLNTDAEGRLVLADVLAYAVDRGAQRLVDLATLTGSCVVALGEEVAGVFTNNQPWCDELVAAARRAGEDVWQMPMFESFSEQLKSDVADCKNVGTRWGGSITAAKFLEKFVGATPWVHLDIAGPAFVESSKPHRDGGGTGTMVRTLVELATIGNRHV
jgi:leucyl aminopeptidase